MDGGRREHRCIAPRATHTTGVRLQDRREGEGACLGCSGCAMHVLEPEPEPEQTPEPQATTETEPVQQQQEPQPEPVQEPEVLQPETEPVEMVSEAVPRMDVRVRIGSARREDQPAAQPAAQPEDALELAPEEAAEHAPEPEPRPDLGGQIDEFVGPEADDQEESCYEESEDATPLEFASSVDTSFSRESLTNEVRFGSTYFRQIIPEPLRVSRDQNVKDHFQFGAGLVGVLDPSQCPGRLRRSATDQASDEVRRRREELLRNRSVSDELNRRPRIGERLRLGNYDTEEEMHFQETHRRQSDAARKEASAYRNMLAQQGWDETEEGYNGDLAPRGLIIPAPAAGFYAWFGEQSDLENSPADGEEAVAKWWHHPARRPASRAQREDWEHVVRPSSATSSRPGSASTARSSVRPSSAVSSRPGSAGSARSRRSADISASTIEGNRESVDLAGRVRPHSAANRLSESESFISDSGMSVRSSGSAASLRASVPSSRRRRPASASSVGAFGTRSSRVELWRSNERKIKGLAANSTANRGANAAARRQSDWPAANAGLMKRSVQGWLSSSAGRSGQAVAQKPRTASQLYAEHRARKQAVKSRKSRGHKTTGTGQLQLELDGGGKAGLVTLLSQSTVWQA